MNQISSKKQISHIYTLYTNSQFKKAEKLALEFLEKDSHNITVLNLLAIIYDALDETDKALKLFLQILEIDSADYAIYNNLGLLYFKKLSFNKAKEMFEKAIALNKADAVLYANLGNVFLEEIDYDKARILYEKALSLGLNTYQIYHSMAKFHMILNEYKEAENMFLKAIELNPKQSDLLFEYSFLCLKQKEYIKGFDLYRYRYDETKTDKQTFLTAKEKLLKKGVNLQNKKLFLSYEQGFGDMIQFVRYVPMFEQLGAKVYVMVSKLLFTLFKKSYPHISFLLEGQSVLYDYHMPLMDAAYFFETEYETIPYGNGYLSVDKQDSQNIYEQYFIYETKKKIGIVWRTNLVSGESFSKQKERTNRNAKLEDFLTYFDDSDIQLYSLQVNVNDEERALLNKKNIVSLGDNFVDFYDNALVIDNLDAVVGIDTVSTIIAGAMGKPTALLLSFYFDWRWTSSESLSNWFKSVKIFRQDGLGDWNSVYKKIVNDDSWLLPLSQIDILMQSATAFHTKGNLSEAELLYRKILKLEPENADAYHYLGLIAYQSGYVQEALKLMQHSLQLNPNNNEAYKNLHNIVKALKETHFMKEYLNFSPPFNIQNFSFRSINHQLTVDEKRLVSSMKLTVDSQEADPLFRSAIALYLELLEDNFYEGLRTYLNGGIGISFQLEKLDMLYKIVTVEGFNSTVDELQLIKEKFDTFLDKDSFELLSIKDKINLLNVFFKFYKLFSDSFKIIYEEYVLPILKSFIKYNYHAEIVLDNKKDTQGLKTFIYITSLYNPFFLDPICKAYVFSELQQLFQTVVLLKGKYFEQFDYLSKNLLMQWYTTLRDGIDDTFVNTKYVLLVNDTSNHYHPGCYMTSMGIKQMLLSKYNEIIDIPIHEMYSNGEMFELTTADKFDDPSIYNSFQEKLPLMDQKLSNAQEIIINGEGTLHNKRPHVTFLLYLAYIAKTKYHKRVSIINHSPYPSYIQVSRDVIADEIYKKVYEKLDFIAIREPRAKELMDELNIKSKLTFDCSSIYLNKLDQKSLLKVTSYNEYIVFSASVVANSNTTEVFREIITQLTQEGKKIVLFNGGPHEEKIFLENLYKYFENNKKVTFIETKSVEHFLSVLKHATMLVSGRFHYSIVSLFLQRPLILLNSNTAKNLGLLEMLHLPNKVFNFDSKDLKNELLEEIRKIELEPEKYILEQQQLNTLEKLARDNVVFQ